MTEKDEVHFSPRSHLSGLGADPKLLVQDGGQQPRKPPRTGWAGGEAHYTRQTIRGDRGQVTDFNASSMCW